MAPQAGDQHRLTRLDNGVRVITAPMRERASVSLAFMFGVGSRYEDLTSAGLSHFIEHMVFKGGERFPTARDISEAIEGVGGALNAATDREMTLFWTKVPAGRLELATDVLADMLSRPVLDPEEVAKERLVVIEELRMYEDNPQDHVHTLFDEVMWPDHPLGRDIAGTEQTVSGFQRADCAGFLERHYRSDRLVVSVTGAVEHDAALATLAPALSRWQVGGTPRFDPALDFHGGGTLRFLNKRTEQANLVVGAAGVSYHDRDRFTVDVLNTVLGEGMSSRLFQELRERRALAYDVHSFTVKLRDTGALAIYIGCEPKRTEQALHAALDELERLADAPVPEAEMVKAREYGKGRLMLQLESTSSLCSYLGQQELLTEEIILPADVLAAIDLVTGEDVQRLARRLLSCGLRAALIGPFRRPERFEQVLAQRSGPAPSDQPAGVSRSHGAP